MTQSFRPSFKSFVGSVAFSSSLAAVALLGHYFLGSRGGLPAKIGYLAMLGFSALFLLNDINVHLRRLELTPIGIIRHGIFAGGVGMRWEEITEATLRERHNPATRTDRLLILKSPRGVFSYPLSVLSRASETAVIEELKCRSRLVIVQDRPAI